MVTDVFMSDPVLFVAGGVFFVFLLALVTINGLDF
jgi:hypothetical protein